MKVYTSLFTAVATSCIFAIALSHPHGTATGSSSYVRWGRTTCPSSCDTSLVYSGRVGGSRFNHQGGAADYLCLPDNPQYSDFTPGTTLWSRISNWLQHDYVLSERQAAELIWSRFVNVHGRPGKNIPNDLHCEHLNRLCKTAIKGLGANKTETCITRIAKALGTIAPLLSNFDIDNDVTDLSSRHRVPNSDKERRIIIATLQFSLTSQTEHTLHLASQEIFFMLNPRSN